MPVATLNGVPVAPGRYFATWSGLTRPQDCFGRLAYRGPGGAESTVAKRTPVISAPTAMTAMTATAAVSLGRRRAHDGTNRDRRQADRDPASGGPGSASSGPPGSGAVTLGSSDMAQVPYVVSIRSSGPATMNALIARSPRSATGVVLTVTPGQWQPNAESEAR